MQKVSFSEFRNSLMLKKVFFLYKKKSYNILERDS